MAILMECKTCGGKVSSSATACPHCGEDGTVKYTFIQKLKRAFIFGSIILVVLFFVIGYISSLSIKSSSVTHVATPKIDIPVTPLKQPVQITPAKIEDKIIKQEVDTTPFLTSTITKLKEQYIFSDYKKITLGELNDMVSTMRSSGRMLNLNKDLYEKTNKKLYEEARALQIKVQTKHYPKMRDALGPLMREKMWEHDVHVSTSGNGFNRITLTGAFFAANRNIKSTKETLSVMLSDYRFKRIDFKWMDGAQEWTYFDLDTKKDNEL